MPHWFVVIQTVNWQIATHYLPYLLDSHFCPDYWKPTAPGVMFHLFMTLLEPFLPLKNTRAEQDVIAIHFLKHFSCCDGPKPLGLFFSLLHIAELT